jgi:Fe-S-cluster-containing hydrogenase component 2
LKKLLTDAKKCTGCGACEEVCSNAWYKEKDKEKSAIRITPDGQGGFTIAVCDQCGDCKDMCSVMALKTAENGVVRLNKKTCVGCLICVGECLRNFMRYHDDLPTPFKCIACGLCAKQCPNGALSLV